MLMNMPGLKIAIPTTPADAKGLLKTAVRDNDPVMFFEDNNLTGTRGEVDDGDYTIPFGVADIKHEGSDVTVVALAGMLRRAVVVAEELEAEDISVEVIDPRTIVPLDTRTILDSVEKTGRLVIVDPAHKSCSVASEISAMVAQEGFWNLQSPIQRVTSLDCHFPFSPALESEVFPNEEKNSRRHIRDPGIAPARGSAHRRILMATQRAPPPVGYEHGRRDADQVARQRGRRDRRGAAAGRDRDGQDQLGAGVASLGGGRSHHGRRGLAREGGRAGGGHRRAGRERAQA